MNKLRAKTNSVRCCCSLAILTIPLVGIGGCRNSTSDTTEVPSAATAPVAAPAAIGNKITAPVFDVPSLIGKDIDGVKAVLGPSTRSASERQSDIRSSQQFGFADDDENYSKPEADLLVRYRPDNKAVTQYFITIHGPKGDGITTDTSQLMLAGNLTNNDPRYKVELISAGTTGEYTGAKVTPQITASAIPTSMPTPAEKTFLVTYKIVGQGASNITYATAEGDIEEKNVTLPWTKTVVLKGLILPSCTLRSSGDGKSLKTAQIIADGQLSSEYRDSPIDILLFSGSGRQKYMPSGFGAIYESMAKEGKEKEQ